MKWTIKTTEKAIRAALMFAEKSGSRRYMQGITIDMTENYPLLVASDGARLIAIRAEYVVRPEQPVVVTVAAESIPTLRNKRDVTIECENEAISMRCSGVKAVLAEADGRFPNWRKLLPASVSGETAQFNGEFLADFLKAQRMLFGESEYPTLHHNGKSAAPVTFSSDAAFGLIMPLTAKETVPYELPSWLAPARARAAA